MLTARRLMVAARAALAIFVVLTGWAIMGPWQDFAGAHRSWQPMLDAGLFYGLTLVAFAAFPNSRRNDLAVALVALGVLLSIAEQAFDGRRHIYEAAFAAIGVLAAHLPSHLEALRKLMREAPASAAFPDRRAKRTVIHQLAWLAAWCLGVVIVVVTLGPQAWRPRLADAQTERFGAYFLTAAAFAMAYPKRRLTVGSMIVVAAVGLELAQFAAPGRDPGLKDALAKALGGLAGVTTIAACSTLLRIAQAALGLPAVNSAARQPANRPSSRPVVAQRRRRLAAPATANSA